MVAFYIIVIIILLAIIWQDFKERAVYWFFFPVLIILVIIKDSYVGNLPFEEYFVNLSFIGLQVSVLHNYYYIKKRRLVKMESYLGLGDVLFFIFLGFLFSPITFLVFQLSSLLLILLYLLFLKNNRNIPLAGCQSIILIIIILINLFTQETLFNSDEILIHYLTRIYE